MFNRLFTIFCVSISYLIMKNLEKRNGFKNRHTDRLPTEKANMKVVTNDVDGEHIMLCEWKPFNKEEYSESNMPADGYLGTVKVIEEQFNGIGFHAWEQNNSEFVYYSVVN
jgi:hypothetical protein